MAISKVLFEIWSFYILASLQTLLLFSIDFSFFFLVFKLSLPIGKCSVVSFGDKFVNNSIITKHIVLIYIQFILKNYQIATFLGYTYRCHKNVNKCFLNVSGGKFIVFGGNKLVINFVIKTFTLIKIWIQYLNMYIITLKVFSGY